MSKNKMLHINLGKDDVGRYAICIDELHKCDVDAFIRRLYECNKNWNDIGLPNLMQANHI